MSYKTINVYLDYYKEDEVYKIENGIIKLNAYYIEKHGADASKTKLKDAVEELGGLEKYTHIRMMGHGSVEDDYITTNNQKGSFNTTHIRHMLSELIESKDNQYIIFELLSCNSASSIGNHSTLKQIIDPLYIQNNTTLCTLGYYDAVMIDNNMQSFHTATIERTICPKEVMLISELKEKVDLLDQEIEQLTDLLPKSENKVQLLKSLEQKIIILDDRTQRITNAINILSNQVNAADNNLNILVNELERLESEKQSTELLIDLSRNTGSLNNEIEQLELAQINLLDQQLEIQDSMKKQIGNRISFFNDIHCVIKLNVISIDDALISKECKSVTYQFPQNGTFDNDGYQNLFNTLESNRTNEKNSQNIQMITLDPIQCFYNVKPSVSEKTTQQHDPS